MYGSREMTFVIAEPYLSTAAAARGTIERHTNFPASMEEVTSIAQAGFSFLSF